MVTLTKPAAPPPPIQPQPKPALITAEEFMLMDSEGVRSELVRGVICEMGGTGHEASIIAAIFVTELMSFVRPRKLGFVSGPDGSVRLERGPDTVRIPDAMFISADRMPPAVNMRSFAESIPNIVVEVKSPNDSRRETHDKARMWHSYGVPLVWAAYPETRTIDVHRADGSITTLTDADTLDGGEILPGFSVAVSEIFDI